MDEYIIISDDTLESTVDTKALPSLSAEIENKIDNIIKQILANESFDSEYDRICKKLGFIPSEYMIDSDTEDDTWVNPFSILTIEEQDYLYDNGYLNPQKGEFMKNTELIFHHIRSSYDTDKQNHNLIDFYRRYLQDKVATREINGLIYYKIIDLYEFRRKKSSIMTLLDTRMHLQIGDILVDENKSKYTVIAFEMPHIPYDIFPDWYLKINFVILDGDPYQIGEYLAKI